MTESDDVPTEEFDTEWTNYGDVNPEPHGGRFVRWDPEHEEFDVVEINRAGTLSPDFEDAPGLYVVTALGVQLSDIWEDGDPSEGFTDDMERILEALDAEHHKEAPGGPPFMDRIQYYVADFTHHMRDSRNSFEEGDFEEVLEKYDVDDWE